jgi:hypothetical protein
MEMADLYQIQSLYSSCGPLILSNLKMLKKEAKWMELKKKSPELTIAILEQFVDEFGNGNDVQIPQIPLQRKIFGSRCYNCGAYGHIARTCPNNDAWYEH